MTAFLGVGPGNAAYTGAVVAVNNVVGLLGRTTDTHIRQIFCGGVLADGPKDPILAGSKTGKFVKYTTWPTFAPSRTVEGEKVKNPVPGMDLFIYLSYLVPNERAHRMDTRDDLCNDKGGKINAITGSLTSPSRTISRYV